MTPGEFKAWLSGYSEAIKDAPSPEQWSTIVSKLQGVREQEPPMELINQTLTLLMTAAAHGPDDQPIEEQMRQIKKQAFLNSAPKE